MAIGLDEIRAFALSLPGTREGSHHGNPDLRVGDRIFVGLARAADGEIALKVAPGDLEVLLGADPETFRDVWGGRWLGVDLARVDPDRARDLVERSWELTAPKRLVRERRGESGG